MTYAFPRLNHIDEIRAAIAERHEFIVVERDDHLVVDYRQIYGDSFPPVEGDATARHLAMLRRECRGLIFDKATGELLSRRFHKFFNLGERAETLADRIDLSRPHHVLDKLDGSMVSAFVGSAARRAGLDARAVRWATMTGETRLAAEVAAFVAASAAPYTRFALDMIAAGFTPIFEWCSPRRRVILDYAEDRLVLLAVRHTADGHYMPYAALSAMAAQYGLPLVGSLADPAAGAAALLERVRRETDREGYVIRFADGHMLKTKSDWYVRIHRMKEVSALETHVLDVVIEGDVDDVLPHLTAERRARLQEFADQVLRSLEAAVRSVGERVAEARARGLDKKAFALSIAQDPLRPLMFSVWVGEDPREAVWQAARKATASATHVERNRHLWGGARWTEPSAVN